MKKNYIDNGDNYYSINDNHVYRKNMDAAQLNKELENFVELKKQHEDHVKKFSDESSLNDEQIKAKRDHENHVKNLDVRIFEIKNLIKK